MAEDRGYTWFGEVLYGLLRSRGSSQSAFAREARGFGYDYRQNSVSNWMRGVHAAPADLPWLLDRMYGLSEEEWLEVGLAYAYGQKLSREVLEDVRRFREFYARVLAAEGEGSPGQALTRKTSSGPSTRRCSDPGK
jgi:transcriptional regulator with XRE-family HTH domain